MRVRTFAIVIAPQRLNAVILRNSYVVPPEDCTTDRAYFNRIGRTYKNIEEVDTAEDQPHNVDCDVSAS